MKNSEKLPKKMDEENVESTADFLIAAARKGLEAGGMKMFDEAHVIQMSGRLHDGLFDFYDNGVKFGFSFNLKQDTDLNKLRDIVQKAVAEADKIRIEYEKKDGDQHLDSDRQKILTYIRANVKGIDKKNSEIILGFESDALDLNRYQEVAMKTGILAMALKEQLIKELRKNKIEFVKSEDIPFGF